MRVKAFLVMIFVIAAFWMISKPQLSTFAGAADNLEIQNKAPAGTASVALLVKNTPCGSLKLVP
jgi:hypothetical protein